MGERVPPLLAAILAALSGCTDTVEAAGCMEVSADRMSCPSHEDVSPNDLFVAGDETCHKEIVEVTGGGSLREREMPTADGGTYTQTLCCYVVEIEDKSDGRNCPVAGRPYVDRGEHRSAVLLSRGTPKATSARATAWARAGAEEHASVASFSRLVLELMALGAPTRLLSEANQAALDEVRHAETCWGFARSLGLDIEVGAFPFIERLELDVPLERLASETVRDGCIAELLGAHLLARAADLATEADVKNALEQMAREEARHAVLAFRIVAWALARGGDSVRVSVRESFENSRFEPNLGELALRANVDVESLRRALNEGVDEVLRPAIGALGVAAARS